MEQAKERIDNMFSAIELRFTNSSRLPVYEREGELHEINALVVRLERELDSFQLFGFAKYATEIEQYETRFDSLKRRLKRMTDQQMSFSQVPNDASVIPEDPQANDVVYQLVAKTNLKLNVGKQRAENMLKMANNMRDQLEQMDDEVALQREKLMSINKQMKNAQSIVNATNKTVKYFTRAVNDDFYLKLMILLVVVMLLLILGIGMTIKRKKGTIEAIKQSEVKAAQKSADYSIIDEKWFAEKRRRLVPKEPSEQKAVELVSVVQTIRVVSMSSI